MSEEKKTPRRTHGGFAAVAAPKGVALGSDQSF
jgi:hypothetical protein